MTATLLVIHILLAVALIAVVLLQRTSADGGGLMGGSSSMGGLMTVRGTANLLTRLTNILAGGFIITSIILTILAGQQAHSRKSITEQIAPVSAPQTEKAPQAPAPASTPTAPAVPLSK